MNDIKLNTLPLQLFVNSVQESILFNLIIILIIQ